MLGISSRALFDLDQENLLFEREGLTAYRAYQRAHENTPLKPGTAFDLVERLLRINRLGKGDIVEVVLISRNDPDTGLRVMNSCEHYGLGVKRACFTDGRATSVYLAPYSIDLFLSVHEEDVRQSLAQGVASALVYPKPKLTASRWRGKRC